MAERSTELNLYLAGVAEDGSNSLVHEMIARAANDEGVTVLNPYRTNPREVIEKHSNGGSATQLRNSFPLMDQADIFAAFFGLRSFPSGIEWGYLMGRRIPGLVFHESQDFPYITEEQKKVVTHAYLSFKEDEESIQTEVKRIIHELITGKKEALVSGSNIFQNGELVIFKDAESATFRGKKLDLGPYKFALLNSLAQEKNQVVPYTALDHLTLSDPSMKGKSEEYIRERAHQRVQDNLTELTQVFGGDHRYFDIYHGFGVMMADVDELMKVAPSGSLTNGKLVYNLIGDTIKIGDSPISLGYIHKRLLRGLMIYQGKVFSYDDLSEVGWSKAGMSVPKNTVQKIIYQMRTRFHKVDPETQYIENNPQGRGYIMNSK